MSKKHLDRLLDKAERLKNGEQPRDVVDIASYEGYVRLAERIMAERYGETSDGRRVDYTMAPSTIRLRMAKLGKREREAVTEKVREMQGLIARAAALKQKAFARHGPTLTDDCNQLEIRLPEMLELFGRYYSATEVHRICLEDWGFDVTLKDVDNFRKLHIEEIEERRAEYRERAPDARLAHKKGRLEELMEIYLDRKRVYLSSRSQVDYRLMLMTLEQLRKEVEGDNININASMDIKVEATLKQHVMQEVLKSLVINDIIIARVAARRRLNPLALLAAFDSSYYAKHTGLSQVEDFQPLTDEGVSIIYPSQKGVEFTQKVQLAERREQVRTQDEELSPMSEGDEETATSLRQRLLERIRGGKAEIDDAKARVERNATNRNK